MRLTHRLCASLGCAIFFVFAPAETSARGQAVHLAGFPRLKQQHHLTCESSAASMATRARISEQQIMRSLPRNPNPNLGFRGNPDGEEGASLVNYGVYAHPIQQALARFDYRSDQLQYDRDQVLRSYLDRGWPVEAWITYALQPGTVRLTSAYGNQFFLVTHEHTVLLVGYDNGHVIANDPWTGTQVEYSWRAFNRSWGLFGRMGLAIDPCPLPSPVDGIQLSKSGLSEGEITWTWRAARHAADYRVTVAEVGKKIAFVHSGVQSSRRYSILFPRPGRFYRIEVSSLSPCQDGSRTVEAFARVQQSEITPAPPTASPSPGEPTPTPTTAP
ncbi:MAG: C39 family peptidase [Chloroflexota bacterium]